MGFCKRYKFLGKGVKVQGEEGEGKRVKKQLIG
jgi:hypothetical protein